MQTEQRPDASPGLPPVPEAEQPEASSSSSISRQGTTEVGKQPTLTMDEVRVLLRASKEEAVSVHGEIMCASGAGITSSALGSSHGDAANRSSELEAAHTWLLDGQKEAEDAQLGKQPSGGVLQGGSIDAVPAEEVEAGLQAAYAQLVESNLQLMAEAKQAVAEASSLRRAAAEVAVLRDAQQGWEVEKAALQAQLAAAMKDAESAAALLQLEQELQDTVEAKEQLAQQLQTQMYAAQAMQEQLLQQLEDTGEIKQELEAEVSQARDREGRLQQQLEMATQGWDQLQKELTSAADHQQLQLKQQLHEAVQAREQLQQQLAGLQQDNTALEEQLQQIEELETQLALMRQEQHQLRQENEQLLAKLAAAEAQILAMKESQMLGLQVPHQEMGLSLTQAAASVHIVRAATESLIGRSPEVRKEAAYMAASYRDHSRI